MPIKMTREQYEKTYGQAPQTQTVEQGPGYFQRVTEAAKSGIQQIKDAHPLQGAKNPLDAIRKAGQIGSGAINTAFSPFSPVFEDTVGRGIQKIVDYTGVADNPQFQNFANSPAGERTSRIAQDVSNYANIAGTVAGSRIGVKAPSATGEFISNAGSKVRGMAAPIKDIVGDVVPSLDRQVNHNVTRALELTADDVNKLYQSTGNEIGSFMGEHNLIGKNKAESMKLVKNLFDENYKNLRKEIGSVDQVYKPSQVPRYIESLKAIKNKLEGVPGLQRAGVEVDKLLGKKEISLADVQHVKELVDAYFNLYKATGDVAEGIQKEGLANVRSDLQVFIEKEVKKSTGADIRAMNNKVTTSKGILDMVNRRSTRGLTRSNLRMGDFGAFGVGTTFAFPMLGPMAPIGGLAAVFVKKVLESPAIQLRIAKYLDGISDARKAKIKSSLEAGQIPDEFTQFVKKKPSSTNGFKGPGAMNLHLPKIDPQDQAVMHNFIDYNRLKKPYNHQLELDASRIAEKYELPMPGKANELANEFDNYLAKYKEVYGVKYKTSTLNN